VEVGHGGGGLRRWEAHAAETHFNGYRLRQINRSSGVSQRLVE